MLGGVGGRREKRESEVMERGIVLAQKRGITTAEKWRGREQEGDGGVKDK